MDSFKGVNFKNTHLPENIYTNVLKVIDFHFPFHNCSLLYNETICLMLSNYTESVQ